jgi:hypothetical protein
MTGAQRNALKALNNDLNRLGKRFPALHRQTGYEDLGHRILALEIAEHTVEETLEHTGLGGEIQRAPKALEIAEGSFHEVAERYE